MNKRYFRSFASCFLVLMYSCFTDGDGPLGTNESDINVAYLKEYRKALNLDKDFLIFQDDKSNCPFSMTVSKKGCEVVELGPLEGQITKLLEVGQSIFPSGSFVRHYGEVHFNINNDGEHEIRFVPFWYKVKDFLLSLDYWRVTKHFPKVFLVTIFLFI